MNRSLLTRTIAIGAVAAGLGTAGVAAYANTSASPTAAATQKNTARAALCQTFLSNFSNDLGKSESDVEAAYKSALSATIDQAVANGKLSEAQAQKLKTALEKRTPCSGLGRIGAKANASIAAKARAAYLQASAKALGISTDELKEDLKKGMSLHQIADSKHITEAQFRSALIANLTADLQKRLGTGPLPLWDHKASPTA
jgi:hypothetical protein